MSKAIEISRLEDLCALVTDGTHDSPKLLTHGVPFIKGKHISGGVIDFESCDFISEADHLKVIARSKPELGDTLFSNIGSVGDAAFVNTTREFSIKNVALFKPDRNKVDARYLFYLLRSHDVVQGLLAHRSGSAQPFIGLSTLRAFEVAHHRDLSVQQCIAAILSAYDDLIENNTRRIAILEEMARRLYEEWFVRFRFPGHEAVEFVETERGEVPLGWSWVPLGQMYETSAGGTPSRKRPEFFGGSVRWVKSKELRDAPIFETEEMITEDGLRQSSAKLFPQDSVLIAMYGATIGQLGVLRAEASTNQAVCALLPSQDAHGWAYAFLSLITRRSELIDLRAGAAQQNVSQAIIKRFPMLLADPETHGAFEAAVKPLLELAFALHRKNANLRAQRDLLLPKLVSGEIDVSGAEAELEAAE